MLIRLTGPDSIRLTAEGPAVSFEAEDEASISPFHLLGASLATCTYSVLHGWAQHADLPLEGLAIDVVWRIDGEPRQVTGIAMDLDWPGLPSERREAARRAAAQCTIHHTLERGTTVETRVRQPSPGGERSGSVAAEAGEPAER